ncbi:hypothetical protein CCM_00676 [Cordyceps militaris CM01]|uniref:Uncharacterized protein n=1 Tax=Cordyceps militaris (strain CM01) TaxID=983644 RepID=G3J5G0_CORMM|nr:uncharacterized protein CCM_00676 [Cordyceps militaris CM01]EGX96021.1 hypothetical protein CCM_00676 [Cordyceps militaris CM01]
MCRDRTSCFETCIEGVARWHWWVRGSVRLVPISWLVASPNSGCNNGPCGLETTGCRRSAAGSVQGKAKPDDSSQWGGTWRGKVHR